MPKVSVKLLLKNSEGCQMVIKISNETLHFQHSGTQTVDLPAKSYIALIAGFLDPAAENPSALVEFKQGTKLLNSIIITDDKFIKPLKVNVTENL